MSENHTITVIPQQSRSVYHAYDDIGATMDAVSKLGLMITRSGMFGCDKIEQGEILALQCIAERKAPLEMAKHYHIIGGKLAMRADAMLAEFRTRGGKVQWLAFDEKEAKARFIFDGNNAELSYSYADAQKAGLVRPGSGWVKHPAEMCRARLVSKAVRMLSPEVCTGTYTPEEISDFDAPDPMPVRNAPVEPVKPPNTPGGIATAAGCVNDAVAFCIAKGMLKDGQSLSDLSVKRAKNITDKPFSFITAVKGFAEAQAAITVDGEVTA